MGESEDQKGSAPLSGNLSAQLALQNARAHEIDAMTTVQKRPMASNSPKGWKTTPYILGNEVSERIAAFGLAWSLVLYLVQVYNMTMETATYILSVSSGITGLLPLIGGFVADTYLGRYRSILIGSFAYLLGMICLLLTAMVPGLTPEPCGGAAAAAAAAKERREGVECAAASRAQLSILFLSFALTAAGAGGLRPCSYAFGADQFEQGSAAGRAQLQSFFNWYYVGVAFSLVVASTLVAYLQLEVGWTWGFAVPAALMALSIFIFLCGSPLYAYVRPAGSPVTELARVAVAAFRNRSAALPDDASQLHLAASSALVHTSQFRFLDKAAVKTSGKAGEEEAEDKWRLCGVQEVESLKCVLRVLPIWVAGIVPGAYLVQQSSWVTLQAATMDRRLGKTSFHVPDSSVSVFSILATMLFLPFYDRVVAPFFRSRRIGIGRRWRARARGISILQRIGFGYALIVVSPIIGGVVESRRRRHGHHGHRMPVLWLSLQLVTLGVAEAFNIVGQIEYYYKEMPPHMRSISGAMFSCGMALGSFLGSAILASAQAISGHTWIDNRNLSRGHLDYYYYYFAGILLLNAVYFAWVCAGGNHYRPTLDDDPPRHELQIDDARVEPLP